MSTSLSPLTKLRPRPVNLLRLLWCLLLLWLELGTFYHHVSQCHWPDHNVRFHDAAVATVTETKPTHVLLVADPQILDHGSYPGRDPALMWISQKIVDMNMRRSWRATQSLNPDVVIFLGDLMDRGRMSVSDSEYEAYYQRFKSMFAMTKDIPVYYIPGNHDVGLGNPTLFSPSSYERFESHFAPLNQHVNIGNHSFVMINAPGLVDEDGHRVSKAVSYEHWAAAMPGGPIEFIRSQAGHNSEIPTILLTHIPLARPEKTDCGPLRERGTIRQGVGWGYQNTLTEEATKFVLEELRPSAIFSGDDHDYCEYWHPIPGINGAKAKEISVKSFSMAMGVKVPGFQLLSLFPPSETNGQSFFDVPCFLPSQLGIYINVYVPFILMSLAALLVSNYYRVKASDQAQIYWSSAGDAGESGSVTNSYLDAGAWRATTPTTMDDSQSQVLLRKLNDPSSDNEDEEAYSLPVPGSSTRHTFPRKTRTCSKSWSFVLFGRRRRMTVDSSCLSSSFLSPFFYMEGHNPESFRRTRAGFFRGFFRDIFDVAWIAVVLFALFAWWTFL